MFCIVSTHFARSAGSRTGAPTVYSRLAASAQPYSFTPMLRPGSGIVHLAYAPVDSSWLFTVSSTLTTIGSMFMPSFLPYSSNGRGIRAASRKRFVSTTRPGR